MAAFIDEAVEKIRDQVGDGRAVCGLSGGVDSSVAAALWMIDPDPDRERVEALGLDIEVVNAAYRALAKQYHPDHAGPEGAQEMAQVNEAYAILSDPKRRAAYADPASRSVRGPTPPPASETPEAVVHSVD